MADEAPRLYVGNLPYSAGAEDIEDFFKSNNIVTKKVDMSVDSISGQNKSYCFVDFHDQEGAQRALELQGAELGGRPIKINPKNDGRQVTGDRPAAKSYGRGWNPREASSSDNSYAFGRQSRNTAAYSTPSAEESTRLWIGGLPHIPDQESLDAEMRQLCQAFNVTAVSKLITPRNAGQWDQQGIQYCCFVDVATTTDAKNAVTMLNGTQSPHGGPYKVRLANSSTDGTRPARHEQADGVSRSYVPRPARNEQVDGISRVFVGSLPFFDTQEALEEEIRSIFAGHDIRQITNLKTPHESKQTEGENFHYCFVELPSPEAARQAIEQLDGQPSPSGAVYRISLAKQNAMTTRTGQDRPRQRQQNSSEAPRNLGGSWRRGP